MTSLVLANLLSPIILSFALGIVARLVRSDLEYPPALSATLSLFLLFAIGLKGGEAITHHDSASIALPAITAILLGIMIPLWTYPLARRVGKLGPADAGSLAAHYGSTSAVTFLATLAFLDQAHITYEGYLPGLLAIMEVPAIAVGIALAKRGMGGGASLGATLHHVLAGRSVLLLLGGMVIGCSADRQGMESIKAFFVAPFKGVLCLFLMELGLLSAARLAGIGRHWRFLVCFAVFAPFVHGSLGVCVGHWAGLSPGGATVMGLLAGSASYIAAPAAVRLALPQADTAMTLSAALGVTFPFNLLVGIPWCHALASFLARPSSLP